MLSYGTDKPDLRNPLKIVDVTEVFARDDVEFNAFKNVIKKGGVVRADPGAAGRRAAAELLRQAKRLGPGSRARRVWATSCSRAVRARGRSPSSSLPLPRRR